MGLHVEAQRGVATYSIELGNRAMVESLPGVPGGSHFLGTFDREEAVENESIDFFASGLQGLSQSLNGPDGIVVHVIIIWQEG